MIDKNQNILHPVYKKLVVDYGCTKINYPNIKRIEFDYKIKGKPLEKLTLNQISWFDGINTIISNESSKIWWEICTQPNFIVSPIKKHYSRLADTKAFYKYIVHNITGCKNKGFKQKNISNETSDLLSHLFTWYDINNSLNKEGIEESALVFKILLNNETKEFQTKFNSLMNKELYDLINTI